MKIKICPKCESKHIRIIKRGYICDDCDRIFSENTSKYRKLLENDLIILNDKTSHEIKHYVFDLLFNKFKMRILNTKDVDINLKRWMDIYFIKYDINEEFSIKNLYKYLTNNDGKCKTCGKDLKFIGVWKRNGGFNKYCSNECLFEARSILQKNNNSVFKIKDKNKWKTNISKSIKNKIKNGDFVPNITNSWSNSKCVCKIDGKYIKFRSSWEAFFNIVHSELLYEKVVIPYVYKNCEHNYIVDFVDVNKKILYEIKPNSEKNKYKNKIKKDFALKWCKQNNFTYLTIDDDWYKNNYKKYKYLILKQENGEELLKKLKQFE